MKNQSVMDEQDMIRQWLWRHNGPSTRPYWGALQFFYDRLAARGHRLVRLIVTKDQPCAFELDHEPISNDALIAFAKDALGVTLDRSLLAPPDGRKNKNAPENIQAVA